jgi:hypothetical protein
MRTLSQLISDYKTNLVGQFDSAKLSHLVIQNKVLAIKNFHQAKNFINNGIRER